MLPQAQLLRNLRQRIAAHQRRAQSRQGPLVRLRMRVEQQPRHAAVEHGITQEFEPLVMARAGAAMRQRRMAQRRLQERIAERAFHPSEEFVRFMPLDHCTFTVLSKCTASDTLAT